MDKCFPPRPCGGRSPYYSILLLPRLRLCHLDSPQSAVMAMLESLAEVENAFVSHRDDWTNLRLSPHCSTLKVLPRPPFHSAYLCNRTAPMQLLEVNDLSMEASIFQATQRHSFLPLLPLSLPQPCAAPPSPSHDPKHSIKYHSTGFI